MFTVDEIVKLILAISVSFSIVVISFQLMRLVAEVTGVVRDLRRTLNEVNRLSELLVNDVEKLRNLAKGVFTVRELFKGNIFAALGDFGKMMSGNKSAGSRQNPAD